MSHRWAPNAWVKISRVFHLWQTHARKSAASLPVSGTSHCRIPVQQPYCYKVGCLSWRHIQHLRIAGRKGWLFKASQFRQRLGLHTSALYLNTSASRWSAGLSHHMSRVRNTLDTVSKAVSGTHTELLSKITRLKTNALKGGKKAEASVESSPKAEESAVTPAPSPNNATPSSTSSSSTTPKTLCDSSRVSPSAATFDASAAASTHNSSQATVTATSLIVCELKEKKLRRVVPAVKASCARKQEEVKPSLSDTEKKSTTSKQTTALFHPSTFSVSLDETYNYLAHHINTYFGISTKTQDKKVDNVDYSSASSQGQQASDVMSVSDKTDSAAPVTPRSSKKGLGHYLSYSAPTVQAFVGSYIAPLVPKFRTAVSKSTAVEEKKPEDAPVKQTEATIIKEQKSAEEKAKKLLLQREKVGLRKQCVFVNFTYIQVRTLIIFSIPRYVWAT